MSVDQPIVSFDGNNVNQSTSYNVRILNSNPISRGIDVMSSSRRNRGGLLDAIVYQPLILNVAIFGADSATARSTWMSNVQQWFSPWHTGTRQLVSTWIDGTTQVYLDVEVLSLAKTNDNGTVMGTIYECVMRAEYPIWRKTTDTVSSSNPATVSNAGNVRAYPSIALTTATHKTLRSCTVAGAGESNGVVAYPVLFALNDSAATSTNIFVYINGVSAPCYVINGGTGTSAIWALVDTAADGSSTAVDIIYGSGITNPLCGALSDPGLFETYSASSTNTSWRWAEWDIAAHARVPGAWIPATTGYHNASIYYQMTSASASATFNLLTSGSSDYDSMYLSVPTGVKSGFGGGITNLYRSTSGIGASGAQAYVRGLLPGGDTWTTLWSTTANGTVTTAISTSQEYIALCCGIENAGAGADPSTAIFDNSSWYMSIEIATPLTVTIGSASNVDYYNGTYVIGDYTITFADTFAPDGTLTIDCHNRTISSSASGSIYNLPKFSDPTAWAALNPGSNTVTDGISATDTITHRESFT